MRPHKCKPDSTGKKCWYCGLPIKKDKNKIDILGMIILSLSIVLLWLYMKLLFPYIPIVYYIIFGIINAVIGLFLKPNYYYGGVFHHLLYGLKNGTIKLEYKRHS